MAVAAAGVLISRCLGCVFAVGMGLCFVPLTLNAVSAVRPQESGLAAALLNTSQQVGGSLGLAVLVTISFLIAGVSAAANRATTTDHLLATVAGFNAGFQAAALAAASVSVVALLVVRSRPREPRQPRDADLPTENPLPFRQAGGDGEHASVAEPLHPRRPSAVIPR